MMSRVTLCAVGAGTVVVSGGSVFLSPDIDGFRNRAVSPSGAEGNFVVGTYTPIQSQTQLTFVLTNAVGTTVYTYPA